MRKPVSAGLSLIAVGAPEGLKVLGSSCSEDAPIPDRRIPHRLVQGMSARGGIGGFVSTVEIEQQKAEIQRLLASEAEIKSLAVDYATILKEKEGELCKLQKENSSLRKSLEAKCGTGHLPKDGNLRAIMSNTVTKGGDDHLSSRQQIHTPGTNAQRSISSKQGTFSNGTLQTSQSEGMLTNSTTATDLHGNDTGFENQHEENSKPGNLESEINQLRAQLDEEREILVNLKLELQEKCKLNESSRKEIHDLKMDKEREKEEMTNSIHQLEKTLEDTCNERDRIQGELGRFKQRLLDKELEESEKKDVDSKIIQELLANSEYQKAHISKLDKALKLEVAKREELKRIKNDEIQLEDVVNDRQHKLADCMNMVNSKNAELLNVQTALEHCCVEGKTKEHLERDLALAREESTTLSELLKIANQDLGISKRENEEVVSRLSQAERMLSESNCTIGKLQEDNSRLHDTVEQTTTRINTMAMDSEYYVDRRIVIRLLMTFFQGKNSKEVLDLMVRMLGFSEEEKRSMCFARESIGKTIGSVLGLPGRFVGGLLAGRLPELPSEVPSEKQSLADLWVDFLLKESETSSAPPSTDERIPAVTIHNSDTDGFPTVDSSADKSSSLPEQNQLSEPEAEFTTMPLLASAS